MYSLGSIMFLRSTCLQWVLLNIFCQLWPSLISNRHKPCKWPYKWHSSEVYFQMVYWFERKEKKRLQHFSQSFLEFLIYTKHVIFVITVKTNPFLQSIIRSHILNLAIMAILDFWSTQKQKCQSNKN